MRYIFWEIFFVRAFVRNSDCDGPKLFCWARLKNGKINSSSKPRLRLFSFYLIKVTRAPSLPLYLPFFFHGILNGLLLFLLLFFSAFVAGTELPLWWGSSRWQLQGGGAGQSSGPPWPLNPWEWMSSGNPQMVRDDRGAGGGRWWCHTLRGNPVLVVASTSRPHSMLRRSTAIERCRWHDRWRKRLREVNVPDVNRLSQSNNPQSVVSKPLWSITVLQCSYKLEEAVWCAF